MFDPTNFRNLASQLCSSEADETSLRTSIGRSYFSAFLSAREKLDSLGHYHPKQRGEDHPGVRNALGYIGRSDLKNKLLGLSIRRGTADYDLNVTVTHEKAQAALQIANNLLSEIPSLT
jgi:uncharacterized protein (UPF0332 family)